MPQNNKKKKIHINPDVKDFANLTLKKYKKKNEEYYESKKELKSSYNMFLIDLLPAAIEFVVKYGYIDDQEVQDTKIQIYAKLNDPDFIKVIKKEIKKGNKIENIKLLPIIIKEILIEANKANADILKNDPNAKTYDMSDLMELSNMILKKKIKKLTKIGVSEAIAFDILSIIPTDDALKASQFYRIRSFYETLYEHAKGAAIPFADVVDCIFTDIYKTPLIVFALLERKEKFSKLTDAQKALYLDISSWCFNTMEKDLDKNECEQVIKLYVNGRRRDESQGKDGNRRYQLSSLSSEDYPKINKVITKMTTENESIKKYL